MTLGGKSLFASTLINGTLIAVMASVVLYPAVKTDNASAASDELGSGWALVLEEPSAAPPSVAEADQPTEPRETSSLAIEAAPFLNTLPPAPTADIIATTAPSALPSIAAPPMSVKAGANSKKHAPLGSETNRGGTRTGLYTPAEYASTPRPSYPAAAKKAGSSGTVILSVSIDETGRPISVATIKSSGCAELDRAAVSTIRTWRFHPAKLDGNAVAARLQVPVRFALKG